MRFPEFHQSLVFPLEITLVFSRIIVNSGKVRLPHKQSQPSMFQTQFQKGDFPAGLHGIGDTLRFIQQLCRQRALSGTAFARRPETAAVSAAGLGHNTGYLAEMKLVPLLEAGGDGREPCNVSLMLDAEPATCARIPASVRILSGNSRPQDTAGSGCSVTLPDIRSTGAGSVPLSGR